MELLYIPVKSLFLKFTCF